MNEREEARVEEARVEDTSAEHVYAAATSRRPGTSTVHARQHLFGLRG